MESQLWPFCADFVFSVLVFGLSQSNNLHVIRMLSALLDLCSYSRQPLIFWVVATSLQSIFLTPVVQLANHPRV